MKIVAVVYQLQINDRESQILSVGALLWTTTSMDADS